MTITTNPSRNEYTATAGQTVFNYTFKIYASTELTVYVTPSGQDADDSTDEVTGFSVTGVLNENGGTITLVTPASAGDLVTIVSNIPSNRLTDYQDNGDFIPDTVNNDVDRTVSLVKQAEDIINRTLVGQESQQNASSLSLPAPVAGRFLKWKSDLSGMENTEVSDQGVLSVGTSIGDVVKLVDDGSGTGAFPNSTLSNRTLPGTTTLDVINGTLSGTREYIRFEPSTATRRPFFTLAGNLSTAHEMTDQLPSDTSAGFYSHTVANGGLVVAGITNSGSEDATFIEGFYGKSSITVDANKAAIVLRAGIASGTDVGNLPNTTRVLDVRNHASNVFTVYGDGDITTNNAPANYSQVFYNDDGAGNWTQFLDNTTGTTNTDGCLFGINGSQTAQIFNFENTDIELATNATVKMTVHNSGDVGVGSQTKPTASGGKVLYFGENSADPTMGANTAGLYAKNVAGTSEMFAVDEAGNVTQISPHNSENEWEFFSRNTKTGRTVRINMERFVARMEEITGEKFMDVEYS